MSDDEDDFDDSEDDFDDDDIDDKDVYVMSDFTVKEIFKYNTR